MSGTDARVSFAGVSGCRLAHPLPMPQDSARAVASGPRAVERIKSCVRSRLSSAHRAPLPHRHGGREERRDHGRVPGQARPGSLSFEALLGLAKPGPAGPRDWSGARGARRPGRCRGPHPRRRRCGRLLGGSRRDLLLTAGRVVEAEASSLVPSTASTPTSTRPGIGAQAEHLTEEVG